MFFQEKVHTSNMKLKSECKIFLFFQKDLTGQLYLLGLNPVRFYVCILFCGIGIKMYACSMAKTISGNQII